MLYDGAKRPPQIFEELQRLAATVDQLKDIRHFASLELLNFHDLRVEIEHIYVHRGSNADFQQCIHDGCESAVMDQLRLLNHLKEQVPSEFTLHTQSGENFFDLSMMEQASLITRDLVGLWNPRKLQHTYFKTKNTMGTGQPSVRDGDEVWFLHGAYLPVVLRPLATGKYRFMGEAYVHGVMYGEAGAECTTRKRITIV